MHASFQRRKHQLLQQLMKDSSFIREVKICLVRVVLYSWSGFLPTGNPVGQRSNDHCENRVMVTGTMAKMAARYGHFGMEELRNEVEAIRRTTDFAPRSPVLERTGERSGQLIKSIGGQCRTLSSTDSKRLPVVAD